MIFTNIRLALSAIRSSKLRSIMTTLAVVIGVAAYVLITTTVDGLKASVSNEINSLGGNLVTITPGNSIIRDEEGEIEGFNFAASLGASTLTELDLLSVMQTDGVAAAAPQMIVSGVVSRGETEVLDGFIMATNQDYPAAFNQTVETGEFFKDDIEGRKVAVVGRGIIDDLFGGTASLGSSITVRGEQFTIVGIMEEVSTGGFDFGPNLNKAVFIPFATGKQFNGGTSLIQEIDLQVSDDADLDLVVAQLEETILKNHGGEKDFSIIKQEEILGVTDSVFDTIKSASQVISYIMLFVGGVVIMLIMLISVTERTREIGIRKSIGATNGNILTQFLTEAVVLTWAGSILGVLVAILAGFGVNSLTDIAPVYTLETILTVLGISTVIGAVFGILPAIRASRKDPIEALRHD